MRVQLIRHGATPGNARHCYIGATDEPLSQAGRAQAAAFCCGDKRQVYVTDLSRTGETAAILYPAAEQLVLCQLREMDFGAFEGKNAQELEADPDYRAWVEGWCQGPCPGGESRERFCDRVCCCFEDTLWQLLEEGQEEGVFVVHGGTIMAVLERFAQPKGDYYSYSLKNCEAYHCTAALQDGRLVLTDLRLGAPE